MSTNLFVGGNNGTKGDSRGRAEGRGQRTEGRGRRAEDGGQRTEGGDGSAPACLRATHRQVPGAPDGVPAVGVPWATSRPGVIRRFGSSPRGRGERRARPVCHRQAAQADARAPHSQTPEDGRQRAGQPPGMESPASRRRQQASRPRSPFPDSRGRKTEGGQPPGTESPASRPRSPDCLFAPSLFSSDDAARAAAPPTQPAPGPPRPPCQARAPRQSPAPNSRAGFDRPRPRHPR